jgi:CPA2 family monovalent cation:H+ antiporter-2
MLEVVRNVIAIVLIFVFVKSLFEWRIAVLGVLLFSFVVFFIFKNKIQNFYSRLEEHFFKNLHEKETLLNKKTRSNLSPWDAHIYYYTINPHADFIGKSLEELKWREQFGVNIAYVERGNQVYFAPQRDLKIYPFDSIGVIGTDEQLKKFGELMLPFEENILEGEVAADLQKIAVDELSKLKGLSIRESGLREKTDGLVVGIERAGQRILNPSSSTQFEYGDIVWLVGNSEKIKQFLELK